MCKTREGIGSAGAQKALRRCNLFAVCADKEAGQKDCLPIMCAHNIRNVQTLSPPRRLYVNKDLSPCNIPDTLKITTIYSGQRELHLGCFSVV